MITREQAIRAFREFGWDDSIRKPEDFTLAIDTIQRMFWSEDPGRSDDVRAAVFREIAADMWQRDHSALNQEES